LREIHLSKNELLYSALRLGAKEFIGVTDSPFGANKKQFIFESLLAQSSLIEKGYAEFDTDDNFVLANGFKDTIDICANCETCITIEERNKGKSPDRKLYYVKDSLIIELQQHDDNITLIPIDTHYTLTKYILGRIKWEVPVPQCTSTISLHSEILWKAKDCFDASTDKANGVQVLIDGGCPNTMVNAISKGISGDAASLAVVAISFDNDKSSLRSGIFVYTKSEIIQLCSESSTADEIIRFKMISSAEARKEIEEVIS